MTVKQWQYIIITLDGDVCGTNDAEMASLAEEEHDCLLIEPATDVIPAWVNPDDGDED